MLGIITPIACVRVIKLFRELLADRLAIHNVSERQWRIKHINDAFVRLFFTIIDQQDLLLVLSEIWEKARNDVCYCRWDLFFN